MLFNKKLYYVAVCEQSRGNMLGFPNAFSTPYPVNEKVSTILHSCIHSKNCQIDFGEKEDQKASFEKYVDHKLKEAPDHNFFSINKTVSNLISWYFKGYKGMVYVVATSHHYDDIIAIECLDELCASYRKASSKWTSDKRTIAQQICCQVVLDRYSSFDIGKAPHIIVSEIDDSIRMKYSASVRYLMNQVDNVKANVHTNIQQQLQNIESADTLEKKSAQAQEYAKDFKKKAKVLNNEMKKRNLRYYAIPLATVTAAGAVVGFMAGGPGGAALLTSMGSIATAQIIESSVVAAIFAAGFIGAESAMESWTTSLQFVPL